MERDRAIGILERLQSAQNAFYAGGSGAMLKQLLTADISWTVPGNNRIAGTYRGLEEVFGYFRRRRFVPGISHFLVQEKPTLCNRVMIDFLTQEPVAMVAPIRTRGAGRGVRTRD